MSFYQELFTVLKEKPLQKEQLSRMKMQLAKKYHLVKIPTDIDIYLHSPVEDAHYFKKILLTKPVRSVSGVAPVAVMSKPYPCPHGTCTFCPGGPGSIFGDVPQSYTGKEPATMRGIRADYDSYLQVFNRLEQYLVTGHVPEKCEVIVMGGTFPSYPHDYQEEFVMNIYKAMNDFSFLFFPDGEFDFSRFREFFLLPGDVRNKERIQKVQQRILQEKARESKTLEKEQEENETATIRCIGLTIETKPDWGFAEVGNWLLHLGCTRIELGIQSVYDEPLRMTNRGHTVTDSRRAIRELKDLGFKLNFHYMLGLPGVTKEQEEKGLKELFANPAYRPDMLKIYPCMVMPGTSLYAQWKAGKYIPLTTKEAAEYIVIFKQHVPEYCRIMRVQRDIPTYRTAAGVDRTNLRQYVEQMLKEKNLFCRCIRCREVGHQAKTPKNISLVTRSYDASKGTEFFIAAEDVHQDILMGFCRLRFPSSQLRSEITPDSALIRELHVYGYALGLGEGGEIQHRGWGKKLLQEAERIALLHGKTKMIVISGVGVREYYRKQGYRQEGPYMVKLLRKD